MRAIAVLSSRILDLSVLNEFGDIDKHRSLDKNTLPYQYSYPDDTARGRCGIRMKRFDRLPLKVIFISNIGTGTSKLLVKRNAEALMNSYGLD